MFNLSFCRPAGVLGNSLFHSANNCGLSRGMYVESMKPVMSGLNFIVQLLPMKSHLFASDIVASEGAFHGFSGPPLETPVVSQDIHGICLCVVAEERLKLVNDEINAR